jgi:O-antigen ligase
VKTRARDIASDHGVWLLATAVVALVVTVATGWFLFPVYAAANGAGTVLYLDGLRHRPARLRRVVVPFLTVLMVPVGLLATLGWRRVDPIDAVLGDEDIRNHTAASNVYADRSRHTGSG